MVVGSARRFLPFVKPYFQRRAVSFRQGNDIYWSVSSLKHVMDLGPLPPEQESSQSSLYMLKYVIPSIFSVSNHGLKNQCSVVPGAPFRGMITSIRTSKLSTMDGVGCGWGAWAQPGRGMAVFPLTKTCWQFFVVVKLLNVFFWGCLSKVFVFSF